MRVGARARGLEHGTVYSTGKEGIEAAIEDAQRKTLEEVSTWRQLQNTPPSLARAVAASLDLGRDCGDDASMMVEKEGVRMKAGGGRADGTPVGNLMMNRDQVSRIET
jgi:hypothetical protein